MISKLENITCENHQFHFEKRAKSVPSSSENRLVLREKIVCSEKRYSSLSISLLCVEETGFCDNLYQMKYVLYSEGYRVCYDCRKSAWSLNESIETDVWLIGLWLLRAQESEEYSVCLNLLMCVVYELYTLQWTVKKS